MVVVGWMRWLVGIGDGWVWLAVRSRLGGVVGAVSWFCLVWRGWLGAVGCGWLVGWLGVLVVLGVFLYVVCLELTTSKTVYARMVLNTTGIKKAE